MGYVITDLQDTELSASLRDGRFSIGSGDNDVIFLPSSFGVVSEHLNLVFFNGVLTLLTAKEQVWVDGVPVVAFPFDVHPNQVISLSQDSHVSFTQEGADLPPIPLIEEQTSEAFFASIDKKKVMRYIQMAVVGTVFSMAIVVVGLVMTNKQDKAPEQVAVATAVSEADIQKYLNETFGERLLSVQFTDEACKVLLDGNPKVNHEQIKVDMEGVLYKMTKPRQAIIEVIDIKQLTQGVVDEFSKKGLKVQEEGKQIIVSGTVPPSQVAALQERINAANAPFLGYREVLAKVSSDDRYNVKLVSVSLGAKEAVATLRYKDQWTVVQEGGRVFGIGTLKLVRPGSIVIGTAHGDMTYGL